MFRNLFIKKELVVNSNTEDIIIHLKKRAKKYRSISFNYLAVIVVIIGFGLYTFSLASSKTVFNLLIEELRESNDNLKSYLQSGNTQKERLQSLIDYNNTLANNIGKYIEGDSYVNFLETLSTKIGSILILLFLVQMLIKVFRYNLRLSNYYQARSDALELTLKTYKGSFEQIVNYLSPDDIDVGHTTTPSEQLVEILKHGSSKSQQVH